MIKPDKVKSIASYQKAIGDGKIIILADPEQKGDSWLVSYEEKRQYQEVTFKSYFEAEEFCTNFGGRNIITVAAPQELMCFNNWNTNDIWNMGHVIKKVKLPKTHFNIKRNNIIPHTAPPSCGSSKAPGNIKQPELSFAEALNVVSLIKEVTAHFAKQTMIDDLQEYLKNTFPGVKFAVSSFVSKNHETGDECLWKKTKIGNNSGGNELRLIKINGKDYQECRIRNILAVADGMAERDCKLVPVKAVPSYQILCGTFLGV